MPIALTDEHEAQRLSARRWLDAHCPPEVPRSLLDVDEEKLLPVWGDMAHQGWPVSYTHLTLPTNREV